MELTDERRAAILAQKEVAEKEIQKLIDLLPEKHKLEIILGHSNILGFYSNSDEYIEYGEYVPTSINIITTIE